MVKSMKTLYAKTMLIDPDTAHSLSQHLMAAGFFTATIFLLRARWFGLSAFYVIMIVDTYARLRYPLHAALRDMLFDPAEKASGKTEFQFYLLLVTAVAATAIIVMLLPALKRSRKGAALLWSGTGIVVGVLALELVSPHDVDTFIYATDIIFVRSAWIYALGAFICAAGAWRHFDGTDTARRSRRLMDPDGSKSSEPA